MNSFCNKILRQHGQHIYMEFELSSGYVTGASDYTKTVLGDVCGSVFYDIFNIEKRVVENITEDESVRLNVVNQDQIPEIRDFYFKVDRDRVLALGLLDHKDCMAALNTGQCILSDSVMLSSELAKEKSELEHLNELKSLFLAIAAHDLRNPLSSIIGYLELLSVTPEGEAQVYANEFLDSVLESATYMQNLLNQYLEVSRIDAGKLELQWKYHNLYLICKKCIEQNTVIAEAKDQNIQFDYEAPNVCLSLDADKIEQVINNLLSNAIKFSEPGQSIALKVQCDNDATTISVKDSGHGIAQDKLKTIFDRYQIAGDIGSPGNINTGLGLYISRVIIDSHGGSIGVESQPGRGSTFSVSLPLLDKSSVFSNQDFTIPEAVAL